MSNGQISATEPGKVPWLLPVIGIVASMVLLVNLTFLNGPAGAIEQKVTV